MASTMASWIPASIKQRILRFALDKVGILEGSTIDLDNLNIALGRKNVLEFRDVGLNVDNLSKLAQLPPAIRLESARILLLRITAPATLTGIKFEVEGIDVVAYLQEEEVVASKAGWEAQGYHRTPGSAQSPSHRKTNRRTGSPPPFSSESKMPTTEDLAKSFLAEEPLEERRELEARAAANAIPVEESFVSQSSDGSEAGTGAAPGLPAFLAGYIQSIIDGLEARVSNIHVHLELPILSGTEQSATGVALKLHSFTVPPAEFGSNRREMKVEDVSVELLGVAESGLSTSQAFSPPSPSASKASRRTQHSDDLLSQPLHSFGTASPRAPEQSVSNANRSLRGSESDTVPMHMQESTMTADMDRFADAGDEQNDESMRSSINDLDIQPGDDNISWASRRSHTSAPADDIWNSPAEEDLPESLILSTGRALPPSRSSQISSRPSERRRRPVSPYGRSLESPGSWPRLEESPQSRRNMQSPGSWPAIDQSQHSMYQPLTPGPAADIADATDNKRHALEASLQPSLYSDSVSSSRENSPEDASHVMAESRVFSHEEAESIYMSAIAPAPPTYMPGAWESESVAQDHDVPGRTSISARQSPDAESQRSPEISKPQEETKPASPVLPASGMATPRAASPDVSKQSPPEQGTAPARLALQLLYIDVVTLFVATSNHTAQGESRSPVVEPQSPRRRSSTISQVGMPGTFSAYSEMTSSHRRGASSVMGSRGSNAFESQQQATVAEQEPLGVDVQIGTAKLQVDLPTLQLLYATGTAVSSGLTDSKLTTDKARPDADAKHNAPSFGLSTQQVQISLHERLVPQQSLPALEAQPVLAALEFKEFRLKSEQDRQEVKIGTLALSVGATRVLTFDQAVESMTSSVVFQDDISVTSSSKTAAGGRTVTEIGAQTRPLKVEVDLAALEDTLRSYGGLSGVLDIGSSMLSDHSPPVSPEPARPSRVRFDGDPEPADFSNELKINARLGGVSVVVRGEECAVALKTSTVKAIHRTNASTARIDRVWLSGPYTRDADEAPASVDLAGLQLFFLNSPQEQDLERLLTLLTPSKDKYDNDDDILIDTLLRQRRKAACLRVEVQDVKAKVTDWQCLRPLEKLAQEVSKLSAVAKYIPEDDRPGLLTMVKVGAVEMRLPVNERFGTLQATCTDIHCAHVPLPALFAIALSNVTISQLGGSGLVHPLVPTTVSDNLPMVMARMLGGEVEPTAKVKLYNVCVEYSVPTLLDLTDSGSTKEPEQIVAELANSVTDLALGAEAMTRAQRVDSDKSESAKKTKIDILMHSSAIGLSPQNAPSKGLLILTDAKLATTVPPDDNVDVGLDIRQAAILITDQAEQSELETSTPRRNPPENTKVDARFLNNLWRKGFVSVGSFTSAHIEVHVTKHSGDVPSAVEVDVCNEFFLLETCADSTQTLIGIMNGLSPPSAPSKQAKYLTEPMSLDDMMSSFTGEDEVVNAQPPPETLFDVDEEPGLDPNELLAASGLGENADELLAESEASFYGPTSGMIGELDEDDAPSEKTYPETAESLLEDDPFEMADVPEDMAFSDATLLKDLRQQSQPAKNNTSVDLGNYEIEDLGFDALGPGQQALGSKHRFSAPTVRARTNKQADIEKKMPFRLRLRDVNATWHLHDGYDWQETRDGLTEAVEKAEQRAEERIANRRRSHTDFDDDEDVIGDCMFNSVYITIPQHVTDPGVIRRGINRQIDDLASESESVPASGASRQTGYSAGGRPVRQQQRRRLKLERSRYHKISFELKGVAADICVFPPDSGELQSAVDVRLKSFEIYDNVPTSTWKKFLTQMPHDGPREMSRPMIHLELQNVKTIADYAATEIVLNVTVQPLRLHVDQDALDFITRFFEFKDSNAPPPAPPNEQPFLQRVEVQTVDLCLDYKPKKVDYVGLRSGHTNEFMNFVILDQANIKLRHAIVYGIHGFEPLHKTLNDVWMPDVKRNQLPTVLAGLAPVRSLVNIGTGVANVVTIPVREYKKDGRIVRSVQKGAYQFGKQTASELARFGAKMAIGTQNLLSGAEGLLSPSAASHSPSNRYLSTSPNSWDSTDPDAEERERRAFSAYADQPLGVLSGLRSARRHLEHDLLTARDALIAVQGEVLESASPGGAAKAVVRHAPTLVLRPVIGASRAVGTALLGVGNAVDRQNVRRMEDVSLLPSARHGRECLLTSLQKYKRR